MRPRLRRDGGTARAAGTGASGLIAAALCLGLHAPILPAADFALSPMVGYRMEGRLQPLDDVHSRRVGNTEALAVALNMAQTETAHYELLYSRQETRLQGDSPLRVKIEYFHIGGTAGLPEGQHEQYLIGTVGATRLSIPGSGRSEDVRPSLSLGLGLERELSARIALRLEVRGYVTWVDGQRELGCLSAPGAGEARCVLRYSGETLWQFETLGGLRFRL